MSDIYIYIQDIYSDNLCFVTIACLQRQKYVVVEKKIEDQCEVSVPNLDLSLKASNSDETQVVTIDVLYISLISPFFFSHSHSASLTHTDTPSPTLSLTPLQKHDAVDAVLPYRRRPTPYRRRRPTPQLPLPSPSTSLLPVRRTSFAFALLYFIDLQVNFCSLVIVSEM